LQTYVYSNIDQYEL